MKHQRGEMPIGSILVTALVVVPLVVLLVVFKDKIAEWVGIEQENLSNTTEYMADPDSG